jgi:hypothetical protein
MVVPGFVYLIWLVVIAGIAIVTARGEVRWFQLVWGAAATFSALQGCSRALSATCAQLPLTCTQGTPDLDALDWVVLAALGGAFYGCLLGLLMLVGRTLWSPSRVGDR